MSLFKVRDWWSVSCGPDEQFDVGCLCIANIDNGPDGHDKIIVGSFKGILRVYGPRPVQEDDGSIGGFKPDDLLLETQLTQPILQIKAGRLSGVNNQLSLAVLHPRKVAVFRISGISGAVEHGTHYHLSLAYEHNLKRNAFSMVLGPFGGVKGQDFICVQSLDGTLSFFEQESYAFSRFLPGFLLPGPLSYVERTDSLVTVSSAWQLESYKYQVLAVATDSNTKEESQNISTGKRVTTDWSFTLGEAALDVEVIQSQNLIFILGEKHWFCFKDIGTLVSIKRLDFNTSAFVPYLAGNNGVNSFLLVTSHSCILYVYQEVTLKWAAQLPFVPVSVKRANLHDLKGVIVILSENGDLACCYLGTNPSIFMPPSVESRELNYAKTDEEMAHLQKIIKASQKSKFVPKGKSEAELSVIVSVAKNLEITSKEQSSEEASEECPSVMLKIQLTSVIPLQKVQLSLQVTKPLLVTHSVFTFPSINESTQVQVSVTAKEKHLPSALTGHAVASYTSEAGIPVVIDQSFSLPLRLVVKSCVPVKEAQHKITINTNRPAVNLFEVFPEFAGDEATSTSQAMGFEYYAGPVVTLLAAKTSQRYRLQSDNYAAVWLIAFELLQRLKQKFHKDTDLLFSYSSNVPLQDYFKFIEDHFQKRNDRKKFDDALMHLAAQFRSVQRRLLTKFKDKTPSSLNNLDVLLEGAHRQVLNMIEAAEQNEHQLSLSASGLSCATQLTVLLVKLLTGMPDAEYEILQSVFCFSIDDGLEQGWEETVDVGLSYLLRTSLAKPGKDQMPVTAEIVFPKDISRLKKHINLVVERLSKGGRLIMKKSGPQLQDDKKNSQENEEEESLAQVPTGSKFGDRKASAKPGSSRAAPVQPKDDDDAAAVSASTAAASEAKNTSADDGANAAGDSSLSSPEKQQENKRKDSLFDLEGNITKSDDIIEF